MSSKTNLNAGKKEALFDSDSDEDEGFSALSSLSLQPNAPSTNGSVASRSKHGEFRNSDFAPSDHGSRMPAPSKKPSKKRRGDDSDSSSPWEESSGEERKHTSKSRSVAASKSRKRRDSDYEDELAKWEIAPEEIQLGKKLGKGAFGVVYKGSLRGKDVAVKKLNAVNFDEETLDAFRKEVAILAKLRHPNVLLFMGACTQPGNLVIVTEFMERGSVYDLLHDKSQTLSFKLRMRWAKEAALGMNWLHRSNPVFIHRDLKTGNLLVDKNWTVKVSDFGLSHVKKKTGPGQKGSYGAIGTPLWMAPEVLLNKEYDETADLYSFAIVLWEILTMEDPFPNIETFSVMLDQVCIENQRPPIPEKCPKTLKDTINACWNPIPEKRPTFEALINNRVFDEIILEGAIGDNMGRDIWRKNFLTKEGLRESVSWREFATALVTYFKKPLPKDPDDIKFKCLYTLLVKNDEVTMESFSRHLDWFGPMEGLNIIDKMHDLMKKPWFHGEISSDQAEKTLAKQKKGTFLVRFSAQNPGCYAVTSIAKDGKLKHYRVLHKPGLHFLIGKIECSSLEEIVGKYKKDLYLKHAAPGSPFTELFEPPKKDKKAIVSVGYTTPNLT